MATVLRSILATVLLVIGVLGCPAEEREARTPIPAPPAPATDDPAAANDPAAAVQGDAKADRERLLQWLDPEAVSVAYLRVPTPLLGDAVAVVYGLPPRAEDLLRAVGDVDQALDAVRPSDAPAADTWIGRPALVTMGRFTRRPYVFHPLTCPRDEAITRLEALGLEREEIDAFEVWMPKRVFPYRVVLLDGDVLGFIPAREPGSGLTPLIAARDMPPSQVEGQLTEVLSQPRAPSVALFAAGPMLHLDLEQSVLAVRFELLRGSSGNVDGQLVLQVDGDPAAAVRALEDRTAPEQSERIKELVRRAAYQVDGAMVAGRLELAPPDAALLFVER